MSVIESAVDGVSRVSGMTGTRFKKPVRPVFVVDPIDTFEKDVFSEYESVDFLNGLGSSEIESMAPSSYGLKAVVPVSRGVDWQMVGVMVGVAALAYRMYKG